MGAGHTPKLVLFKTVTTLKSVVIACVLMLPIETVVALCIGWSLGQAVSIAAVISIRGLAGWNLYRWISQRNDGYFLLLVFGAPMGMDEPFLVSLLLGILFVTLPSAYFMGWWNRVPAAKLSEKHTVHPMADVELDSMTASIR
jgi:hypothetical protein